MDDNLGPDRASWKRSASSEAVNQSLSEDGPDRASWKPRAVAEPAFPSIGPIEPADARSPAPSSAWQRLKAQAGPSFMPGMLAGVKALLVAAATAFLLFLVLLATYRFVDPPFSMLTLSERLSGNTVDQRWVPLDAISPNLLVAVISSEDGQFCSHHGVDFREMAQAMQAASRSGEDVRGASTISMQVIKNLFLWPGKSYVRKALEIPMTLLMELVWPKRRILEIYLNIAEWGPGIYGAEAAARYYFKKPAARLNDREAALMAVSLPNPIARHAGRPGPGMLRLAGIIERRARVIGSRAAACTRAGLAG